MFPSTNTLRLPLKGTLSLPTRAQIQPPLAHTAVLHGPPRKSRTPAYSPNMFSTQSALLNKHTRPKPDSEESGSDPMQTPSVTLEALGIGKNMKLFLIAVLGVFGTIETWFWCKAIWIWWKGDREGGEIVK